MKGYLLFFPKSFDSSIACFQWLVIIFQSVDWLLGFGVTQISSVSVVSALGIHSAVSESPERTATDTH